MGVEHAIGAKRAETLSVFLSYDRDDMQKARTFVKALESQHFSIWWDGLISGGHAFADRIQEALTESDVVVVLWSESSARSHWVRDEAGFGRDQTGWCRCRSTAPRRRSASSKSRPSTLASWNGRADAPEFEQLCHSIRSVGGASAGPRQHRPGRRCCRAAR